jgi:hypothetical protein
MPNAHACKKWGYSTWAPLWFDSPWNRLSELVASKQHWQRVYILLFSWLHSDQRRIRFAAQWLSVSRLQGPSNFRENLNTNAAKLLLVYDSVSWIWKAGSIWVRTRHDATHYQSDNTQSGWEQQISEKHQSEHRLQHERTEALRNGQCFAAILSNHTQRRKLNLPFLNFC